MRRHAAIIQELGLPVPFGLLAPDLDQALIRLILGRSAYLTAEERAAETLASLVLCNAVTC